MDQQKKWLENENYIRFAGAMLMLSPFMNFLVSMWLNPSVNVNWTINEFIVIFMSVSALNWIGRIASFVVGFLMLRGKNTAWTPVLFILAFMIVKNFLTFKADFQISSMQALSNLGINLFLFYLVYQSSEASYEKKRTPKVSPYKRFLIKNNMPIEFAGYGKIGEVVHSSIDEVWLRPTNHLPKDIHRRIVTICDPLQKGKIRLKFSSIHENSVLIFRMIN